MSFWFWSVAISFGVGWLMGRASGRGAEKLELKAAMRKVSGQ